MKVFIEKQFLFVYLLKKTYIIVDQRTSKDKQISIFNHITMFGYRSSWRIGQQEVSEYLNLEVNAYEVHILIPRLVDTITEFILQNYVRR